MAMEALAEGLCGSFVQRNRNHHGFLDFPFLSDPPEDATLRLINQMLMEEDGLEDKPCMFQESLALQATEKSFYDAIGQKYPPSATTAPAAATDHGALIPPDNTSSSTSTESSYSSASVNFYFYGNSTYGERLESCVSMDPLLVSPFQVPHSCNGSQPVWRLFKGRNPEEVSQFLPRTGYANVSSSETTRRAFVADNNRNLETKKTHDREGGDCVGGGRTNKKLANSAEAYQSDVSEMLDKLLLCPRLSPHLNQEPPVCLHDHNDETILKLEEKGLRGGSNGGKTRRKKQGGCRELVDLTNALSRCAEAVANADTRTARELLKHIRQHSSPNGNASDRLAYYFANALEARLVGTGAALYTAFNTKRISVADILKPHQAYVKAIPFNKISNLFANGSITKLVIEAKSLHIIHFGIMYGFQWPCLIQHLSARPGGPPKLHITGIDLPQPGFRPAERVEETGRRLATYCQRFNVPFQYTAIAKKWESIKLADLNIDRDEVLVVNCLYRLKNVPDEIGAANSPREAVLNLVRRIHPDMFVHGVLNGTYSLPFFLARFREALFHFNAGFDMWDATVPREDEDRMLFEKEIFGRDIMNIIACEGPERVERPNKYKQWQVWNTRAGLRQLPLDKEILKDARAKLKSYYHKDFAVSEDGNWMLQGWKGRIMYAISCWKPVTGIQ